CNGKLDITKQVGPCGIPWKTWERNGDSDTAQSGADSGGVVDYFYQYGPLFGDNLCSDGTTKWNYTDQCNNKDKPANQVDYFGYKVLGGGYGATLQLFGYKGTLLAAGTTQQNNNSVPQSVLGTQGATGASAAPAAATDSGASSAANNATSIADQARNLLLHRG